MTFPQRLVALALAAMIAVLIWSGLASPVRGEEQIAAPSRDRRALSEIAQDVLRRGSTGANQSAPEPTSGGPQAEKPPSAGVSAPELLPPVTHNAPARETIGVPIVPSPSAARKKVIPDPAVTGYQSNSGRQPHPGTTRALSFSSGALAPSAGLDPALAARASGLRAQGRQFVYGFLLPRAPLDGALEKKLAGLGVELLGPHDDHHKARLPVGSLQAVAALPDVEWVGVSAPAQKLSPELTDVRGAQTRAAASDAADSLPIVINLFEGDEGGGFRRQLEAVGAALGEYDAALRFYRAVATWPVIEKITDLDFVLFVELIQMGSSGHDQSTPLIDADLIRPGSVSFPQRFGGGPTTVGILDTGFMAGGNAPIMHSDLFKWGCGVNFTADAAGVWNDEFGHGTHVLATIAGTGTANIRYRGVAPDVGSTSSHRIRAAKIFRGIDGRGFQSWMESGMDWMADASHCDSGPPQVINISGGFSGIGQTGTDSTSRKLDDKVWTNRQTYVVCSGNEGPGSQTIRTPGVAKNALTVGNVWDNSYLSVGEIEGTSSRGPTGDGRMKPNVVAPGIWITSARAGTTDQYKPDFGCSMATPHVTGLAATLMEHYPEFRDKPALLRAHMMATAVAHDDVTAMSNDYGLGQVSGYLEHWAQFDATGWRTNWFWGGVNSSGFQSGDITVPPGTQRLVVVLTWDEPAASAGASRAVTYDVDLWVDRFANCPAGVGTCGDYASVSSIDNVEYLVINNPPEGVYRLKAVPFNAPSFSLPFGIAAITILGDPTPPINAFLSAPSSTPLGSVFSVAATVTNSSYLLNGVQVEPTLIPLGVTLLDVQTPRWDGVNMSFLNDPEALTLGNVVSGVARAAFWNFRAETLGPKTFKIRVWSENGGEVTLPHTVDVVALPNLVETAVSANPATPTRTPGTTFSVTDTVRNAGIARSGPSTTRYILETPGIHPPGTGFFPLTGTRAVPGLDAGASQGGTVTVTIPADTPPGTFFLLACADALNAVVEVDDNNCIRSATPIVTVVTSPDLVETATTTNPPAPTLAPGAAFAVTDTVQNIGGTASGSTKTRYYLSLDAVKSADDRLLNGSRGVPDLAAGGSHSGTVTVTVPAATPLNSYFLLACADDLSAVAETGEGNNCIASAGPTVTVARPDLVESAISAPPATKARRATFQVTDTVQNVGPVAAGASATRYYLSPDGTKSPGDTLLTGSRGIPSLAAGGSHSGTVMVTIPGTTPANTYFLLACADNANTVIETDESNNCKASSTTVTVTP